MEPDALRSTPLRDTHVALGARMVPFAGWEMPVYYTSISEEHRAVREAAGLFDVSHMGEVEVRGPDAAAFVQRLVTNDASRVADGQAQYTVLCRADGTAVDDLLAYRRAADDWLLVINASNIDKDLAHMRAVHAEAGLDCTLTDVSDQTALLALQGPRALDILGAVTDTVPDDLGYYRFVAPADGAFLGLSDVLISRTGYTGEPGVEIYCRAEDAQAVWDALMAAGAPLGLRPAGLGARDTLRLEAGFCLYGNDLTDDTTPLDAGLGWVVKPDAADFVGRDALAAQKAAGPERRLVGFRIDGRGVPRPGYALTDADGTPIGEVTSGTQSPTLGAGIGLGYVPNDPAYTTPGSRLGVAVRSKILDATVVKPPFHKR